VEDFGYRKLIVWQKAVELVGIVYEEIKKFPLDERFALIDKHLCSSSPLTFI
jgi:hypothetical protein